MELYKLYKVCRIDEDDYGCEELPEGEPVRCRVTLQGLPGPEGAGRGNMMLALGISEC